MDQRRYYSYRTDKTGKRLDLDQLRELFYHLYSRFHSNGYFDLLYGRQCSDNQWRSEPGEVGVSVESFFLIALRKENIYPVQEHYKSYEEDDVFDLIELLFDHAHYRTDGAKHHGWCDCGGCEAQYDKERGQTEYRAQMNQVLHDYSDGYELDGRGEIVRLLDAGLVPLMKAPLPQWDEGNVEERVEAAKRKFQRGRASLDERRDAVKALADVLEYLRDDVVKRVLPNRDDQDLFNIANNFAIRHHNQRQKNQYEARIWLDWMFCLYLSTIHAALRLANQQKRQ